MTIFDYINSVLYTKNHITLNCDDESQFNSFMFNRWVSFYSSDMNNIVNEVTNRQIPSLITKQDQYDMFFYIMPKLKYKKIDYIKKVKKEDKEEEVYIPEFLSKREYKQYVEFKNSISK